MVRRCQASERSPPRKDTVGHITVQYVPDALTTDVEYDKAQGVRTGLVVCIINKLTMSRKASSIVETCYGFRSRHHGEQGGRATFSTSFVVVAGGGDDVIIRLDSTNMPTLI